MLYDSDPYLGEFDAIVESVTDGKYVVLSDTAFYPQGGGQPNDTGVLLKDCIEYPVVFVGKFSGNVSHEVAKPGLSAGDRVRGKIDWTRRHMLMRMHTAGHILSVVVHRESGAEITGSQLGVDKSRLDFSLENFDRSLIGGFEAKVNEIVAKALPIEVNVLSREEAVKIPSVFRLAKGFSEDIKEIRVVKIGNADTQACGGTHVKNTSEIKAIKIVNAENKGKSNRRIYYSLEQ
jgi:misacylated tRNA(Ala) deacylase